MSQGFGTDTWCLDGLRTGRLVTGVQLLAQAIYRRLTTPRGTLRGAPDEGAISYGLDLSSYVGSVGVALAQASLPSLIRAELRKDDRIADVRVTVSVDVDDLTVEIDVTPADEVDNFTLTLGVSALGTNFLGVA